MLGMSKTIYLNASGLPDDEQVTTARDQSTLGRAIQDRFPRYYRYFSTAELHLPRPFDRQPQSSARLGRGRRRHQDRLYPLFRLQPCDFDASGQPPSGRCGHGRPQRQLARRHHAQPSRRKSRKGLDPAARSPRLPSTIRLRPMWKLPTPSKRLRRRPRPPLKFRPRRFRSCLRRRGRRRPLR